jgi:BMFP domain-containing protein YqiC
MTLHSELDRVEGYNERLEERCADLEARLADLTNAQDVTESNRGYARWTD